MWHLSVAAPSRPVWKDMQQVPSDKRARGAGRGCTRWDLRNLSPVACLPDQRTEYHQNPHQCRIRFDPVEQRTINCGTLEPPNEVAQTQ